MTMRAAAKELFWLLFVIFAISITLSAGFDRHRSDLYRDEGSVAEPTQF